jgi:hypothetical protein
MNITLTMHAAQKAHRGSTMDMTWKTLPTRNPHKIFAQNVRGLGGRKAWTVSKGRFHEVNTSLFTAHDKGINDEAH